MSRSFGQPWFAPKKVGYGSALPIRWQGWASTAAFALAIIGATVCTAGVARLALILTAVAGFAVVCAMKTEGGWRWRPPA